VSRLFPTTVRRLAITRVGLLSVTDPRKGLWRDAQSLLWALGSGAWRFCGAGLGAVSLFPVDHYSDVEGRPGDARSQEPAGPMRQAVRPGTALGDWLGNLDVLIALETLLPQTFSLARRQGARVIYVPNLDWATLDDSNDPELWIEALQNSSAEVWAKTKCVQQRLRGAGIQACSVPWSIPDRVRRRRTRAVRGSVRFFLNAGMGGWENRRGADIALQALARARAAGPGVRLTVKTIRPLAEYVPASLRRQPGLEIVEGRWSRKQLLAFQDRFDAVLHPSRWEGFGLPLLEALHAGLPVLVTDGWPMNELVIHEKNGLLIPARRLGEVRLAPRWECDVDALARAMVRLAEDGRLRQGLTGATPGVWEERQEQFVASVLSAVAGNG
jgi:hypothetical protein